MRSLNNHPVWHNQPLRLTDEEIKDPLLVLNDFFECFHLNDLREILWNWLIEVVSSPNCISSEPLERSNHFYLYEKLEALIEACYVFKNLVAAKLQSEGDVPVVPV